MLFMCPGKPFHEENASTKIYSLLFFEQGVFQIFGDSFIGSVAKHAIYVTGNVFSWNDFSRKLFVCIIFFQSLSRRFLDFCPLYWQVCIQRVHRNIPRKNFFPIKINIVFRFFATKNGFWKTIRHAAENFLLRIQRNIRSYFFEYVVSRIIVFRRWTNIFLPPMERFWHGCESGILRDQRTVTGAFSFNVKEPILFDNFRPWAEESKFFGCFFWQDFQKCIPFDQIKIWSINFYFLYVFGLWVYSSLDFGKQS